MPRQKHCQKNNFSEIPENYFSRPLTRKTSSLPPRSLQSNSEQSGAVADGAIVRYTVAEATGSRESPGAYSGSYFPCANLQCGGLGADSDPSRITSVI